MAPFHRGKELSVGSTQGAAEERKVDYCCIDRTGGVLWGTCSGGDMVALAKTRANGEKKYKQYGEECMTGLSKEYISDLTLPPMNLKVHPTVWL